jgi:RimJ/RimL family protein N-acetyltransferase
MKYGRDVLRLVKVLAITTPDNEASGKLLKKLGFKFENLIKQPSDDAELRLFSFEYQS